MSNLSNNSSPFPSKEKVCGIPVQGTFVYLLVLLIFVMIVTFAGNLLVIFAVLFFRRLRSITNYFIFSLAVSDLLISLLSLPFRIDQNIHNGHWCLSLVACQTWIIFDSVCTFASMWNLAIISIDRFVAIKLPFQYHSLITIKTCVVMITCVWTYSGILTMLILTDNWTWPGIPRFGIIRECSFRDPYYSTVAVSLSFFTPLLIVLVMYGMVFEVALNQTRAMAALQIDLGGGRGGRRSSVNLIREVKAAKTLAIVVGCFIVCWLPFNVIFLIILWNPNLILSLSLGTRLGLSLTFIYVLPALNSTMNPVIYALFNREFRSAFLRLFRRIAGNRMGAVGYGGTLDHSSAISTIRDEAITRPSKSIKFQEYDGEYPNNSPLPTIRQHGLHSYGNDAYTDHTNDDNLNVKNDTYSMETTLEDDKKTKVEDTPATTHNSHVTDDITQNNISQNNCDVIDDDIPGTPKKAMSVKLPPLQRNVSLSGEEESYCVQRVKSNILPPIGPPRLIIDSVHDEEDAKGEVHNTAL